MGAEPRILRADEGVPSRRIAAAVLDADRRVREAVAAAEARAREVLTAAEAERARVLAEAREAGRREGEARAAAALVRAAEARDRLLRDAGREVASLALAVARKVLGRELAAPESVLPLAEAALAAARGRREVVLRVHPTNARAIRAGEGRLAAALGRAPVEVREDAALVPGAVVVDTEAGRIDAGIEAQLEVLERAVAEALP
jgi:flagellar biosynthesis/type III secretory pathway protein FliH